MCEGWNELYARVISAACATCSRVELADLVAPQISGSPS